MRRILALAGFLVALGSPAAYAQTVTAELEFEPSDELLSNPLMGWAFYSKPGDVARMDNGAIFPPIAGRVPKDYFDVVTVMVGWNALEPSPGVFDFDELKSAVALLKSWGKTVYLRLNLVAGQIPIWAIRGTACWHFDTGGHDPCSFDPDGYPPDYDQLSSFAQAEVRRVGYACALEEHCDGPGNCISVDDGELHAGQTQAVCDLYDQGVCFEPPPPGEPRRCRLPPTNHPIYQSPLFRSRAEAFLQRAAAELPDVDYWHVQIYGTAGEWDQGRNAYPWADTITKRESLAELRKIYKRTFANHRALPAINFPSWSNAALQQMFPATPPENLGTKYLKNSSLDRALENGFAIRYDAFNPDSQPVPYVRDVIAASWKDHLIAGEPGGGSFEPGKLLTRQLESHTNFVSIATSNPASWERLRTVTDWPEIWERGQLAMGYRLYVSKSKMPVSIGTSVPFKIKTWWNNLAVGHLVGDYGMRISFVDSGGATVWEHDDPDFDPTRVFNKNDYDPDAVPAWNADTIPKKIVTSLAFPGSMSAGSYSVRIALVGGHPADPEILLAMPPETVDPTGRYIVGEISVAN